MSQTERMRAFIIKFLYIGIWAGIIFCLLKYALPLFMPFVIAFAIAFALKPLINRLASKTPLGRKSSAVILLILAYAVFGTLITFLAVRLVIFLGHWFADLPRLYATYVEPAIDTVGGWFDGLLVNLSPDILAFLDSAGESISNAVFGLLNQISSWAISFLTGMASRVPWFVVGLVLCIIASFFFVVDYYKVTGFVVGQLGENARRRLFVIKDFVVGTLLRFARAYAILLSITFAEVSVGLLILRVPNPFLIAFFTAIVDILPIFGTGTIMIPWALYNLFTGNYFLGIGLAVLYIVITLIRQVLEPRVVGRQIGLYPLLTLICMFIGARLFGFWGMLGFPVTLVVLIYLNRIGEISIFRTGDSGAAAPAGTAPDGAKEGKAPLAVRLAGWLRKKRPNRRAKAAPGAKAAKPGAPEPDAPKLGEEDTRPAADTSGTETGEPDGESPPDSH